MTSRLYANNVFPSESEFESEAEEEGRIGNADWCQCGECKSYRKVCVVRTITKYFLKAKIKEALLGISLKKSKLRGDFLNKTSV